MNRENRTITDKNDRRYFEFKDRLIRENDIKAWRKVMSSKEGRWFVMRLLDFTKYKLPSFTGNSQTFFNEGLRAVGIHLDQCIMSNLGVEGFKLKQKAEKEYVLEQERVKQLFEEE